MPVVSRKRKRQPSVDAFGVAATKIQRCWRAYVSSDQRNSKLPEDPITCEVIRGYPFKLIASERTTYYFDARALAEYFDTTLNFSNPLTREKLNSVEVRRLHKQLWFVQKGRYRNLHQAYESRKKLAQEIRADTDFMNVVSRAIDDELYHLFRYAHRLTEAYKQMRGAIVSGNIFPVSLVTHSYNTNTIEHTELSDESLATIESEYYYNVQNQIESQALPTIRAYFYTMANVLYKNRRLSPNMIDTFCKDKILDLTKNASNFGSSRIFADNMVLFFTTVRSYYSTDTIVAQQMIRK